MFNQRGQIHIILLVLLVVGFILYLNFSGSDIVDKWLKGYKITPPTKSSPKISTPPASVPTTPTPPALTIPDTAPPTRLNSQPTGNLPSETRRITLSLETDEKATCRYSSDVAGIHYDSMQGAFSQTNGASHSVLITTLSEGGKYKYYIKCSDERGNKNIDDYVISFEVRTPEDKTPPVLINPSHTGDILPAEAKEALISISTNEPASCRYSTNEGTLYSSMTGSFSYYDQTKKFHTKKITGLENGKSYDLFVRCRDLFGNSNTGDVLISFKVDTP